MNKTDIINAGLFAIGSKKIFAPTDNTKSAKLANSIYQFCRGLVFEMPIDWVWCTARSGQLAQLDDPATGYDHQYAMPDNGVRVLSMVSEDSDDIEYTFEEGVFIEAGDPTTIITKTIQTNVDAADAFVKYIVLIEDEGMYPSWFAQLISLNIAVYISEPIKQHTPHYTKVKDMLANAITFAEEANGRHNVKVNKNTHQNDDYGNNDLTDAAVIAGAVNKDLSL